MFDILFTYVLLPLPMCVCCIRPLLFNKALPRHLSQSSAVKIIMLLAKKPKEVPLSTAQAGEAAMVAEGTAGAVVVAAVGTAGAMEAAAAVETKRGSPRKTTAMRTKKKAAQEQKMRAGRPEKKPWSPNEKKQLLRSEGLLRT